MHDIPTEQSTREFLQCWQAAGRHLNAQVPGEIQAWLRADPIPPFLEHLSFRLGNQLFFVRLEDAHNQARFPGDARGLHMIAKACGGHPCLMPMRWNPSREDWEPVIAGWGLVDADTGIPVNPAACSTPERIVMTDWEVQDFAVQVVRDQLRRDHHRLMSWQGNPGVDPSIWFVGESGGPEWVVVRAVRFPTLEAAMPGHWRDIADSCAWLSPIGHFASVTFVSAAQGQPEHDDAVVPLWRGEGVQAIYKGFQ